MKHRPRKRFSQNFLIDTQVIDRIVESIGPGAGDLIIEVGPGREALTRPLAASGADVIVVEIDRDLAAALQHGGRYTVHELDALKADFGAMACGRPYRLVGNLPYNISTPLLFHVLSQSPPPLDMHFMLQKEVVERLAAQPGGKDYGRLTVMCRNLCDVIPLFDVDAGAFDPAPRVESAVVRLLPRPEPLVSAQLAHALERVVRQAFSMRRKILRNSLNSLLDATAIETAGVDPAGRPEQLSFEGFAALAAAFAAQPVENR